MTRRALAGLMLAAVMVVAGAGVEVGGWEKPRAGVVETHGRLAVGNRVHVVGQTGGKLVHRSSADHGATWGKETVIAEGTQYVPMMYGGLAAARDCVYLVTADGYMGGEARQLDFWKSTDNGATWSGPVRITDEGHPMFRARVVVSGEFVHVAGAGRPEPEGSLVYCRSKDGGKTWEKERVLAEKCGPYGGGQTVAVDGKTVHAAFTKAREGVGAGDSFYLRSEDNGETWSKAVEFGEKGEESDRQARIQIVAAGGHVLATWQREGKFTGAEVPKMRLGYNTSGDGGKTWDAAKVLPGEGTDRNHQQVWMGADGVVHLCWREGAVTETDAMGYMASKDFGKTWETGRSGFATGKANHPYSVAGDGEWVHVLTGPLEEMVYSRRRVR